MGAAFGFETEAANPLHIAWMELQAAIRAWPTTLIAAIWWAIIWKLILPLGREMDSETATGTGLEFVARILWTSVTLGITSYVWLMKPYSVFYLGIVTFLGASILAFLGYSRRHRVRA